jgi:hypothetical protein
MPILGWFAMTSSDPCCTYWCCISLWKCGCPCRSVAANDNIRINHVGAGFCYWLCSIIIAIILLAIWGASTNPMVTDALFIVGIIFAGMIILCLPHWLYRGSDPSGGDYLRMISDQPRKWQRVVNELTLRDELLATQRTSYQRVVDMQV